MSNVLTPAEDRRCPGAQAPEPGSVRRSPTRKRAEVQRDADRELMRAVAAQQAPAEAELVERVLGLVRQRARLLTRSDADADDAAQNSMIEILRSAKNYRGEGSLESWCERIAIRTTLRHQRRQSRDLQRLGSTDPDLIPSETAPRRLSEEIPGVLADYLDELSDDRRQALVLRHVLELSVDEIAEHSGVSRNTVKDRLRMARRQLRSAIRQRELIASAAPQDPSQDPRHDPSDAAGGGQP